MKTIDMFRRYNSSQSWRSWIDIVLAIEWDMTRYTLAAMYIEQLETLTGKHKPIDLMDNK